MGKIPKDLLQTIAANIRSCRVNKFPGRGGGKKCAEAFGVSPQQWSPWERGMRTPDELRLQQIADFFGVTVEFLRRDNSVRKPDAMAVAGNTAFTGFYGESYQPMPPTLREPEAPPYGLPSLRRDDNMVSLGGVSDLAQTTGRLMAMVCNITKGVVEGRFDVGKTIVILRRISDILGQKLQEAEGQPTTNAPSQQQY
jgi:transcriptional regulator with XRE-family HTH domain